MNIQLIPYKNTYDADITELENSVVQGKHIKLRILKNHFLDRSVVFENYFPCLAVNKEKRLVGTAIGAKTKIIINGKMYNAGFGYDVKVHPAHRNNGVGRTMATHQKEWFKAEGLEKNFITLKLSNAPVVKLIAKAVGKIWLYDFVYLTIPSKARISEPFVRKAAQKFFVKLFDREALSPNYYTEFSGHLGYFHTYKLYRLKLEKLSWLYRQGLRILKKINPKKYSQLPVEQEVMEFATLYNHTENNMANMNTVLEHLEAKGKKYLLVCCCKNDSIYDYLKKYSINTYGYYILSDFPLKGKDEVTLDVRCL